MGDERWARRGAVGGPDSGYLHDKFPAIFRERIPSLNMNSYKRCAQVDVNVLSVVSG
jgi:hypothetical protein